MKFLLKNEFSIAIVAALLFIPFLGQVHLFDWDEINFSESAREMIGTGNFFSVQINYKSFTEKPPLFFWFQVLSMKVFGVNEFAARFPNAICGILTLLTLFRIGRKVFSINLARIWVMVYFGTFLTFLYFKSGIIDPWFNLFIFLGIYHFQFLTTEIEKKSVRHSMLAGLFLGLAVLTKGPVAILISLLCYLAFVLLNRFKFYIKAKELLLLILVCFVVCFAWFGIDLIKNGPRFIIEFVQRQVAIFSTNDAGHAQPFFYHWVVLLLGCFPASLFFVRGMFVAVDTDSKAVFKKWMLLLFWVTLLLFSIVKTKIVHYSSLCWFPLTFLAALSIEELWMQKKQKLNTLLHVLLVAIGLIFSIAIAAIPFVMMSKEKWIVWVKDEFARANLQANVHWTVMDGVGGFILLAALVFYLFSTKQIIKTQLLFASVTVCCLLTAILITPKIEAISQRANIEFFESKKATDCYVGSIGFKSYVPYFYAAVRPFVNDSVGNNEYILHGKIDKPVFIVSKEKNVQELSGIKGLELLYRKNGFVFYQRLP